MRVTEVAPPAHLSVQEEEIGLQMQDSDARLMFTCLPLIEKAVVRVVYQLPFGGELFAPRFSSNSAGRLSPLAQLPHHLCDCRSETGAAAL